MSLVYRDTWIFSSAMKRRINVHVHADEVEGTATNLSVRSHVFECSGPWRSTYDFQKCRTCHQVFV